MDDDISCVITFFYPFIKIQHINLLSCYVMRYCSSTSRGRSCYLLGLYFENKAPPVRVPPSAILSAPDTFAYKCNRVRGYAKNVRWTSAGKRACIHLALSVDQGRLIYCKDGFCIICNCIRADTIDDYAAASGRTRLHMQNRPADMIAYAILSSG